jgi:hypothetical protein
MPRGSRIKCVGLYFSEKGEITGGWIKVSYEELHDFYSSPKCGTYGVEEEYIQDFGGET